MPDTSRSVVINTVPLIALSVATVILDVLRILYGHIVVPHEVWLENQAGGSDAPGVAELLFCDWIE